MDFLFGYGSIINEASRQATSRNAGIAAPPAVVVNLVGQPLLRSWYVMTTALQILYVFDTLYVHLRCFRSHTGFTALGLLRSTCVPSSPIVGVLFPVGDEDVKVLYMVILTLPWNSLIRCPSP
jgi:hypothetical protein